MPRRDEAAAPAGPRPVRALAWLWQRLAWVDAIAPPPPATVPLRQRLLIAAVIGVLSCLFAYHQLTGRQFLASDFQYDLRAAERLLAGQDPYHDPTSRPDLPYPFDANFPYPLFAALMAVPFTALPPYVAGALYVGLLSAVMAFAVTRDSLWRLSFFLSPCYFVAASVANWSPLLVAAAYLPVLYPFAIVKPTMVAPIMLSFPSRRGFLLCLPMLLLSLIAMPTWPWSWLGSIIGQPGGKYSLPLLAFPGLLLLYALLWWRSREARLLLMFALIPQHVFFYDQLLLWLIPRSLKASLFLSALGWAGYLTFFALLGEGNGALAMTSWGPGLSWIVLWFYLPALLVVGAQERARVRAARLRPAAEGSAA